MKVDFSGYITKNDIKCTDGRTIKGGAFSHNDQAVVPLVWNHLHDDPENYLGNVYLENRPDGVYGYGTFNNSKKAQAVKELVSHGDLSNLSIYANKLQQDDFGNVYKGDIKEVSIVMAGANPGAKIEQVSLQHSDGTFTDLDDEAVIRHTGFIDEPDGAGAEIYNKDDESEEPTTVLEHADDGNNESGTKAGDVWKTITNKLDETELDLIYAMIGEAAAQNESSAAQSDQDDNTLTHNEGGDDNMRRNTFEQYGVDKSAAIKTGGELTHADIEKIAKATFSEMRDGGETFKNALSHATQEYGIENIEILFPEARVVNGQQPEWIKRRTEWVSTVLNGVKKSPFSRIKTRFADITADEARARGYMKGNKKVEEVFPVMQRTTTPQTIYKKQKLDRDDIIDITEFSVVEWLWSEMRLMLDEEIARAVLVGDGRLVTSADKIKEEHIRPIWTDDEFYSYKLQLPSTRTLMDLEDAFIRSKLTYEGAGSPIALMSPEAVTDLMLQRDKEDNRKYKTEAELMAQLRVSRIIEIPLFYGLTRTGKSVDDASGADKTWALDGIIVNLSDYTIGTDRGGQIARFEDFDIDYNQYKYLLETRMSGALTGYHSAIVIEHETTAAGSRTAARAR